MMISTDRTAIRFLNVLLVTLFISACSSGGGGGTPAEQPVVYNGITTAAVISTTNATTLVNNIIGSPETSPMLAGVTISGTNSTSIDALTIAGHLNKILHTLHEHLATTDFSTPMVSGVIPIDEIEYCDSGLITYQGTLNDNGTGTVSVIYDHCRYGDETTTGKATLQIYEFNMAYLEITDSTLSFTRMTITGPGYSFSATGSARIQLTISTHTETIIMNMVAKDNTNGTMIKMENFRSVNVYDNLFSPSSFSERITGRVYDSELGYVDITTISPLLFSTMNTYLPDGGGQILITGANNASILVTVFSGQWVILELDIDGDTSYEIYRPLLWTELATDAGADIADSDGDLMHDSWETTNGLDPLDSTDASQDADSDGVSNYLEYLARTDPNDSNTHPPLADLAVTVDSSHDKVAVSMNFTYTLTIHNGGPDSAEGVVLTDVLPAEVTAYSASASQGTCTGNTTITCNLNTLSSGTSASVVIYITAASATSMATNTVSVSSYTLDQDSGNNSATNYTNILALGADIQGLIDAATNGDTIALSPGWYLGGFSFNGKDINLQSTDGPLNTFILVSESSSVTIGPLGSLNGFTILNAAATAITNSAVKILGDGSVITGNIFDGNQQLSGYSGAAISGNSSSPTIESNIFRSNSCDNQFNAGVVAFVNASSPLIVNNIFENNACRGINLSLPSGNHPVVINNTLIGNRAGIYIDRRVTQSTQTHRNNLIAQNEIGLEVTFGSETENPLWENNLLYGNGVNYSGIADLTGVSGNISLAPLLVDISNGDYHLSAGSPAIDAGSDTSAPLIDFEGLSRPVDGDSSGTATTDIGAYEYR